jgi:hypothetical protein
VGNAEHKKLVSGEGSLVEKIMKAVYLDIEKKGV